MLDFIVNNAATIATIFFFGVFCYVVYSVFKKGAKKEFEKFSKIPMEDNSFNKK